MGGSMGGCFFFDAHNKLYINPLSTFKYGRMYGRLVFLEAPQTEPLFSVNRGSVHTRQSLCSDQTEALFFSEAFITFPHYFRLFPSKYANTVHIRQNRPVKFDKCLSMSYLRTVFSKHSSINSNINLITIQ